jgi:cellulose biosynthesis protein BcsQ
VNSIITFYSFKGGVGRSMALANIGYLLATKMGKRVLCVDWDLEAPGLEKYFAGCPGANVQLASKGGLIDLLTSACQGESVDWREYVSTVTIGTQAIGLIVSGLQDAEYAGRVLEFDWRLFFENAKGGAFIERLRNEWLAEYKFTLIDSRTGFTDSGGVCTVQLPDILVPVFTTTEESARGAIDVIERAQAARQKLAYDRSPLMVFPLPSRYDGRTQYQEAKAWLHNFAEWFDPYYADWVPQGIAAFQVIERTKLPYVGYFSFGTQMPVATEGTSDPESLGFAYNIAATIIGNDFQQVEELIAAVPDLPNQPSREELAVFRMRRGLQEGKFEWRSIDALARAAGIGVTEALDILRGEPEIDFSRGKSGRVIVRLRDPLQSLESQRQKFMIQRAAGRDKFNKINPSSATPRIGYIESSFFPDRFSASQFDLETISNAAKLGSEALTSWLFLYHGFEHTYVIEDGIETLVGEDEDLNFWRIRQSGYLYHISAMVPFSQSVNGQDVPVVDFRAIAIHISKALVCLTNVYKALVKDDESVSFALTLLGTGGRRLISSPMPLRAAYICRIDEINAEHRKSLAAWREGLVGHAVDIANEVYLRFNWPSPNLQAARQAVQSALGPRLNDE